MFRYAFALLTLSALASAASAEPNAERARFNYMLHCQGCHLPDAMGTAGKVPRMNGFVGYFLHSAEGRDFIIKVPGIATSVLPDEQISELVNWMVFEFSEEQVPVNFRPYEAAEVGRLRRQPETDPAARRGEILENLVKTVPALECYTDEWVTLGDCT